MHGYELKKQMAESLEPIMRVSWGSLYPALARLESRGAVKVVEANIAGPSIPMTGSLGGERAAFRSSGERTRGVRNKKVYGITELGSSLFFEMLNEADTDEKGFAIRLVFARYLSPEMRLQILTGRRDQILQKVKLSRKSSDKKRFPLEPYFELVLEHFRSADTSELAWIEGLIARETRSAEAGSKDQPLMSHEING